MSTVIIFLSLFIQMVMGVSIITRNGKTDIYINNKKVDLSKATVIETTPDYTVYQPIEDENTTIVINKGGGVMVYSNGSVQISNGSKMTPQQQQEFKRKMEEFEKKMICERQALQQRLSNLGQEINNRVHDSLSNVFNDRFLRNLF